MKRSYRSLGSTVNALLVLLAFSTVSARASQELDRKFALESIGFLKAADNVDGIFAEYVGQAYRDYFMKQSRFTLQDLSKADAVMGKSKLTYAKLIDDPQILGQIARALRSEAIIRTKIRKDGPQYRFSLELLHAPAMDLVSSETFTLRETPGSETAVGIGDMKAELGKAIEAMVAKVPFKGRVTGRDNNSVTVNVGAGAGIKKGDTLVIATLDEVKKHPLLHQIVDWRLTPVGKIEVDQVEDAIAFCHVVEEEQGRQISRWQKVAQVIGKPLPPQPEIIRDHDEELARLEEPPRLGWVAGGLWIGSFSRQFSTSATGATGLAGSGFVTGVKTEGQLWMNKEFFAELGLGYGYWGYSQHDIATGASTAAAGVSGTAFHWRGDLGYSYLMNGDMFGPKGWIKIGYHSTSYGLPISTAESTSPNSFKAFFLGVGADLPIRSQYGLQMNLDFGLFPSASQTGLSLGTVNTATVVEFFIGGYYRVNQRMSARAGIDVLAHGADFGTTSASSLSQRIFSFSPTLLYYF